MWNSKPKKRSCNCRSRARNNPKYSGGICYLCGDVRPTVKERIEGKRQAKTWLEASHAGVDLDDVEV